MCACVFVHMCVCVCVRVYVCVCVHLCMHNIYTCAYICTEMEAGNVGNEYAKSYRKSEEYTYLQQELSPILDKARRNPIGWTPNYANILFWQVTS